MKKYILTLTLFTFFLAPIALNASFASHSKSETKNTETITSLQNAMAELKNLSRKEKRGKFSEIKQAFKTYRQQKKAGTNPSEETFLLVLLAIIVPPLAVYLHEGEINTTFWISIALTILGFALFGFLGTVFLGSIPAIIHALIVVLGN